MAGEGGGAEGEAVQVCRVTIGDGALVGGVVDGVGDEEGEHHEEDHDEEEQPDVGHYDVLHLPQPDGNHHQIHEADAEEQQSHYQKHSHRNEEEGQRPRIVVL